MAFIQDFQGLKCTTYRSTLKIQPKPIQLCFVLSMHALVLKAVQKPEPMTRDFWSNARICGQKRGRTVL